MHSKPPQRKSSTALDTARGITLLIRTEVTKVSAVLSIGRNKCFGPLKHCSKTLAAVARLDRPKLVPTLLVHKCSCGIVIAYDAEKMEWAVPSSTRSLDMTTPDETPDDRSIASLAEVCSAGARSGPHFAIMHPGS